MIFQPFTSTGLRLPPQPVLVRNTAARDASSPATQTSETVRALLGVLALVLVIRAVVFATGFAAVQAAPVTSWYGSGQAWLAWDALHYVDILNRGYDAPRFAGDVPNDACFFPLLPLMAWPLTFFMPAGAALVVLSNAFTVLAAALVYLWAREFAGHRAAALGCLLAMAYPSAVFFSSGYTEAPFLCATAGVLLLVQRKQLVAAAIVCGLATGLRPTGAALVAYVGYSALGEWGTQLAAKCRAYRIEMTDRSHVLHSFFAGGLKVLLIGFLSVTGIFAYQSYLVNRYHRTDAYFAAQKSWQTPDDAAMRVYAASHNPLVSADTQANGGDTVPVKESLAAKVFAPGAVNRLLWIGVMVLTVWGFFAPGVVPRAAFLIPLVIFLLGYLPGWGARSSSIARFMTAAVPCFCFAAVHLSQPKWRRVGGILVVGMVLIQIGYAWSFSRGLWTG